MQAFDQAAAYCWWEAMMSNDDEDVGYRKPPKHTRFKPGQSGNPQGRKPQFGSFDADLLAELNEEISVGDNGNERKMSKQRAVINALITAAIGGNVRAASAVLAICGRPSPPPAEQNPEATSEADDQLLANFKRRQRGATTNETTPPKKQKGADNEK
jgi:Family of unknown function (DUF5681)